MSDSKPEQIIPKQIIVHAEVTGGIQQQTDNPGTNQAIANVRAGSINQTAGKPPESHLSVGAWKAKGSVAVIGLVLVVLGYLLVKYLTA